MFSGLTQKLHGLFSSFGAHKKLTEDNVAEAVREVRLALLEADVNYTVAGNFVKRVKEKALGDDVVRSVTPQQHFVKIVHDELVALMGSEEEPLNLKGSPAVILLCGLQGSGKTTLCAKLAVHLKKNKKVMVAACDLQRLAAVDQLKTLCAAQEVPVFSIEGESDPLRVAKKALEKVKEEGYEVLIVDTAGRLHLDEALMEQLEAMKKLLQPQEVLFVANSTIGQDAVKTAAAFNQRVEITGTVLTMLDGNAKAGAALSIREVTGKPLKFEGIGEKISDLQPFNPRSMADRILGMGDVVNLVRKAKEHVDEKENAELEKKLRKALFTYEDYLKQVGMIKKMGSFKSLLKMLPGMPDIGEIDEKEFRKIEAMILSMTHEERQEKEELVPGRRARIAKGSGATIDDVNRMVKGFKRLKQLMKEMPKMKQQLGKENLWR